VRGAIAKPVQLNREESVRPAFHFTTQPSTESRICGVRPVRAPRPTQLGGHIDEPENQNRPANSVLNFPTVVTVTANGQFTWQETNPLTGQVTVR
jgi:hypothetical protein